MIWFTTSWLRISLIFIVGSQDLSSSRSRIEFYLRWINFILLIFEFLFIKFISIFHSLDLFYLTQLLFLISLQLSSLLILNLLLLFLKTKQLFSLLVF